jgi:hypothetical protein
MWFLWYFRGHLGENRRDGWLKYCLGLLYPKLSVIGFLIYRNYSLLSDKILILTNGSLVECQEIPAIHVTS